MSFFSDINAWMVEMMGPLGPVMVLGGLGLLMMLLAIPIFMRKPPEPFAKLNAQRMAATRPSQAGQELRRGEKVDKLQKFAGFLEPKDEETMTTARLTMLRAGYKGKNSVRMFHFAQLVLGIGFLAVGMTYAIVLSSTQEVSTQFMAIATIGPGGAGYYLPQYWVKRRVQQRRDVIVSGFPDALDLMLVCIEAGQSLDQSINRLAVESRAGYPALAEEFDMVAQQIKAGKERVQVLKDMSDRVGVPDISSFVTTLVQSATFGTSIADALRVYSIEMRDKRVMRAEEKANTLPTKLTLGTMLFTLPPLLIILIGPSIAGIVKNLGGG